jgi:Ras-related protein Rab-7A
MTILTHKPSVQEYVLSKHNHDNSHHHLIVVCIGSSGVGKTSLMHRWVKGSVSGDYKTTIGADFMAKSVKLADGSEAMLQVWDTAGQEKFASLGRAFFRGSDLCVLVCALNDPKSLER